MNWGNVVNNTIKANWFFQQILCKIIFEISPINHSVLFTYFCRFFIMFVTFSMQNCECKLCGSFFFLSWNAFSQFTLSIIKTSKITTRKLLNISHITFSFDFLFQTNFIRIRWKMSIQKNGQIFNTKKILFYRYPIERKINIFQTILFKLC